MTADTHHNQWPSYAIPPFSLCQWMVLMQLLCCSLTAQQSIVASLYPLINPCNTCKTGLLKGELAKKDESVAKKQKSDSAGSEIWIKCGGI